MPLSWSIRMDSNACQWDFWRSGCNQAREYMCHRRRRCWLGHVRILRREVCAEGKSREWALRVSRDEVETSPQRCGLCSTHVLHKSHREKNPIVHSDACFDTDTCLRILPRRWRRSWRRRRTGRLGSCYSRCLASSRDSSRTSLAYPSEVVQQLPGEKLFCVALDYLQ